MRSLIARYRRWQDGCRETGIRLRGQASQHAHPIGKWAFLLSLAYFLPIVGAPLLVTAACLAYRSWTEMRYRSRVASYAEECVQPHINQLDASKTTGGGDVKNSEPLHPPAAK